MSAYWDRVVEEYVEGATRYALEGKNRVALKTEHLDRIQATGERMYGISFPTSFRDETIRNDLMILADTASLTHHDTEPHTGYALDLVKRALSTGFVEYEGKHTVTYRHVIEPATLERALSIVNELYQPSGHADLTFRARNLDQDEIRSFGAPAQSLLFIRYDAGSERDSLEALRAIALRGSDDRTMSPRELDTRVLEKVLERIRAF